MRKIPYINATAGCYVFAKLAVNARTWADEANFVQLLKNKGVLAAGGRSYATPPTNMGWVRITFAVEEERLNEALRRIGLVLDQIDEETHTLLNDGDIFEDIIEEASSLK